MLSQNSDEVSCPSIDVTWPSRALQPPNLVVGASAQKSTWPMRKWSTGDETFSSAMRIFWESLCLRAGMPLSSLCRQVKSGMHNYESYHSDANPPPPKAKLYNLKQWSSSKTNGTVVRWRYTGITRWRQVHTEVAWQRHKSIKQWYNHPNFQRPHATGENSKCIEIPETQMGVCSN